MIRIRTSMELFRFLDEDYTWRVQDVSHLKQLIDAAKGKRRDTIVRAAVPAIYAHWEGFIKNAASAYASFLSEADLKFLEIKECFRGIRALEHTRTLSEIKKKIFTSTTLLQKLEGIPAEKVKIPLEGYINNVGNLNYDLFVEIVQFLDLREDFYKSKQKLIDESLLKRRNDIAHGEFLPVEAAAVIDLADEILILISLFKNEIENAVAQKSYLKLAPAAVLSTVQST